MKFLEKECSDIFIGYGTNLAIKIKLEKISDDNPLKLVFKIAKGLLQTGARDEDILKAKINLADELKSYDKVKNTDRIKALVDFLEYLFLSSAIYGLSFFCA